MAAGKASRLQQRRKTDAARVANRQKLAWQLRIQGKGLKEIGEALKVSTSQAARDIESVFKETVDASRAYCERYKQEAVDRHEAVLNKLWPLLDMPDDAIRAAEAIRGHLAELSKLRGAYEPEKHEHAGKGGAPIAFDARLELVDRIAALASRAAGKPAGSGAATDNSPAVPDRS